MANKNLDNFAHEFALVIGQMLRKMRHASPQDSEFSWTQKSLLVRLGDEGPMTISELARAEGVKSQSMGTAVAALEAFGIVERLPHPTDGRQVNVQITSLGSEMRKSARTARRTWLAESMAKLEKADQKILSDALAVLKKLADL